MKLKITAAEAVLIERSTLTSGMVGKAVKLAFSGEWNGLTKAIVFRAGSVAVDDFLPEGEEVETTIPKKVMRPKQRLEIGVVGYDADETVVIPTVWCDCGIIAQGAETSGNMTEGDNLSFFDKAMLALDETKGIAEEVRSAAENGEFNGKSAYEIAVRNGFEGTEQEWLDSIMSGASAYDIAVENGFEGSEKEWLASLKGEKGETGETGAQGPQGVQGLQGTQGPQGPKGDAGATGSKGDKGDKGDTGPQGPQGETGEKGDKGDKGDTGATGPQGVQGIQGIQGEPGKAFSIYKTYASVSAMNADAANVPEGNFVLIVSDVEDEDNAKLYVKGASEFSFLTDMSGAQGMQGPQGPQGIQGEQGEKGETGAQGPQGETGPQGPQGTTGATGAQGPAGPVFTPEVSDVGELFWTNNGGLQNPPSVNIKGPKGDTGATGPQGVQGIQGPQGPQGETGEKGPAGADGATAAEVIAALPTETWTFTLSDGSTVDKVVPLV